MRLPVLDAGSRACASCHGPCCLAYIVPINGFDLVRLARGLGVPWERLVDLGFEDFPACDGFRLDGGPRHYHFRLKRRENGACILLLEIDETHRRCGVHALRPDGCRRYPLLALDDGSIGFAEDHAVCPEPQAQAYREARAELGPAVLATAEEREFYRQAVMYWDRRARREPRGAPLPVAVFVDWITNVYDTRDPEIALP
jgi:Fe-S-cluster containining protein